MYNSTIWLHLLRCDATTNEICDSLESFTLIEEVIGSIFGMHARNASYPR